PAAHPLGRRRGGPLLLRVRPDDGEDALAERLHRRPRRARRHSPRRAPPRPRRRRGAAQGAEEADGKGIGARSQKSGARIPATVILAPGFWLLASTSEPSLVVPLAAVPHPH